MAQEVRKTAGQPAATSFPAKVAPYKEPPDTLDAMVYMVLADAGSENADMREFLYRDRTNLAVYCKAMYGLAMVKQGHKDKLDMILQNISQYLIKDNEDQTAYLKIPEDNFWWCWYGSDVEADAYYLKLLSKTDPKGETAPLLAKYLINNRKNASYWTNTRDTAIAIEAFADYIRGSGEDKPDMTVTISLDGKKVKEVKIDSTNLFSFDNKLEVFGDAVTAGKHKLEFTKAGTGPLYFNAYVTNFTLEDPIKKAGLEVKVDRKYYKLVKVDASVKVSGSRGQALDQKVEKYERKLLKDGDMLDSGELVVVEIEIDSKNDYEYVLFEDMKAAGFEPVEVQSGYNGNDLNAYMELRDERVCFFARTLARGKHSVAYRLRAEIPGAFSAAPCRPGPAAMYAPELKANSDEFKVRIGDTPLLRPARAELLSDGTLFSSRFTTHSLLQLAEWVPWASVLTCPCGTACLKMLPPRASEYACRGATGFGKPCSGPAARAVGRGRIRRSPEYTDAQRLAGQNHPNAKRRLLDDYFSNPNSRSHSPSARSSSRESSG